MYPVVLVAMGLGVIFLAVQYQQYETSINNLFNQLTPDIIHHFLSDYTHWEFVHKYQISQQSSATVDVVYEYVFWSSAAVNGLIKLSCPVLIGLTLVVIILLMMLYIVTNILEAFDKQSVGTVKVFTHMLTCLFLGVNLGKSTSIDVTQSTTM